MTSCRAYQRLEWFRKSPLARVVYFGQRVTEYGPITVTGTVTQACTAETDGDCTFNVADDAGAPWHCEVTPCAPDIQAAARQLKAGDRVRVVGTKRWDPPHILGGLTGKWEVHPVSGIVRIL